MITLGSEQEWRGGKTAVALGTFDGVHRGHQRLIQRAVEAAHRQGLSAVVSTFDVHPLSVLCPEKAPLLLNDNLQKSEIMARMGVDALIYNRFTQEFAASPPEAYIERMVRALHPAYVVAGYNYSFGAKGAGNAALLEKMQERMGYRLLITEPVRIGGRPVSSTWVRESLAQGDLRQTEELLGRPYDLLGQVIDGKHMGRRLGFPTANLRLPQGRALPLNGVYVAELKIEGQNEFLPAVLNQGRHPTLPQGGATIEVHVLNYHGNLYGRRVWVRYRKFLRPERAFDSVQALSAQLERDKQAAQAFFEP